MQINEAFTFWQLNKVVFINVLSEVTGRWIGDYLQSFSVAMTARAARLLYITYD